MIRVSESSVQGNEEQYLRQCVTNNQFSMGPFVKRLEAEFERCHGGRAIACSSGTSALHLALLALGIGEGDLVLVPALSYVASANAVTYCGARPVFCDVESDTWTMSVESAARAMKRWNGSIKAIMTVDLYGVQTDPKLYELADQYGCAVVEDAAESLGADLNPESKTIRVYSFYGNKIITCGEGGMLILPEMLAESARLYGRQGQGSRRYWHDVVGYNYRMSDLNAAVALAQFETIGDRVAAYAWVHDCYAEALKSHGETFVTQKTRNRKTNDWMNVVLLPRDVDRDRVMVFLEAAGIETRPAFTSLHRLPMYAVPKESHPVAEEVSSRGVCLPTHARLTRADIGYVVSTLVEVVTRIQNGELQ